MFPNNMQRIIGNDVSDQYNTLVNRMQNFQQIQQNFMNQQVNISPFSNDFLNKALMTQNPQQPLQQMNSAAFLQQKQNQMLINNNLNQAFIPQDNLITNMLKSKIQLEQIVNQTQIAQAQQLASDKLQQLNNNFNIQSLINPLEQCNNNLNVLKFQKLRELNEQNQNLLALSQFKMLLYNQNQQQQQQEYASMFQKQLLLQQQQQQQVLQSKSSTVEQQQLLQLQQLQQKNNYQQINIKMEEQQQQHMIQEQESGQKEQEQIQQQSSRPQEVVHNQELKDSVKFNSNLHNQSSQLKSKKKHKKLKKNLIKLKFFEKVDESLEKSHPENENIDLGQDSNQDRKRSKRILAKKKTQLLKLKKQLQKIQKEQSVKTQQQSQSSKKDKSNSPIFTKKQKIKSVEAISQEKIIKFKTKSSKIVSESNFSNDQFNEQDDNQTSQSLENFDQTPTLSKKQKSLAQRNVKINFASGLHNFIEFLVILAKKRKQNERFARLNKLLAWIKQHMKYFVSFNGWKMLFTDDQFGHQLSSIAKLFFNKKYAIDYITNSRVNKSYLIEHKKQIWKFLFAIEHTQYLKARFFRDDGDIDFNPTF